MSKLKRRSRLILSSALALGILMSLGYARQRWKFVQRANELFDPQEKAFHGLFLPWPIGHPTLAGGFDPETDRRIRAGLRYESGSVSSNEMTLIIHNSDGTFLVHAN